MKFDKISKNIGLIICSTSLLIYFLIKLPFNLSVNCLNENLGFYLIYGDFLTSKKELYTSLISCSLFGIIIKSFGFNLISVFACKIIQTFIVLLTGASIYILVKSIIKEKIYPGLAVLFWILLILTPIGASPILHELNSHLNLENEHLISLFSILTLLLMNKAGFFNNHQDKKYAFIAGSCSIIPLFIKANGLFLFIGISIWFLYLFLFIKRKCQKIQSMIIVFLSGFLFTFIVLNLITLLLIDQGLITYWINNFTAGKYSTYSTNNFSTLINIFYFYISRGCNNFSNIFILSTSIILSIIFILKKDPFKSLISILFLSNSLAIIAPGTYESYYYLLVWIYVAILLALLLHSIRNISNKLFYIFLTLYIFLFTYKILFNLEGYQELYRINNRLMFYKQKETFIDPIQKLDYSNIDRPPEFKIADIINHYLSDKNQIFYIIDFSKNRNSLLNQSTYIYAKRRAGSTVCRDHFMKGTVLSRKITILKTDLLNHPPDLIVLNNTEDIVQNNHLTPIINWLYAYTRNNYSLIEEVNYINYLGNPESIYLLRRNLPGN